MRCGSGCGRGSVAIVNPTETSTATRMKIRCPMTLLLLMISEIEAILNGNPSQTRRFKIRTPQMSTTNSINDFDFNPFVVVFLPSYSFTHLHTFDLFVCFSL